MKKIILFTLLFSSLSFGIIKDKNSNDVYSQAEILKNKIIHLAGERNVHAEYMKIPRQYNKSPRHVLQKTLEVLKKINKYREIHNLGEVNIPIYPSRVITSEDVYFNLTRLNDELDLLLKKISCPHIQGLSISKIYFDKTSNDAYYEVWLASLAMDELLGKGFSPTDNYEQSLLIIDVIKFLRNTQSIYSDKPLPEKQNRKHPNHVLYATHQLLNKISDAEKRLWMDPVDVPQNPQRIITPTEVYDSMQTIVTELKRIRRRIGVERFYEAPVVAQTKNPSDVLQNIEYAIELFPDFEISKDLKQYDIKSLTKTIDELYALSAFVLRKINYLKKYKGILVSSTEIPYIHNLNEMHVYQKSIETMEKINKMRLVNGLYEVAVPKSPTKKKKSNDIFDILLMIDDEISIVMKKNGVKNVKSWNYLVEKDSYSGKSYSDIYNNLWKIASSADNLRGDSYTSNETYLLAKRIEQRIAKIVKIFIKKDINTDYIKSVNKQASDVFNLSLKLYDRLSLILKRANISGGKIQIPKEIVVTSDTVYNSLRIINASLIDINIHFGIESDMEEVLINEDKTPSQVFDVVNNVYNTINLLMEDSSYEN